MTETRSTPLTNFRDLGGTSVAGGRVRAGVIWRSDDPSISPAEEVADLVSRGLSDVVDLRGDFEHGLTGIGHLAGRKVRHHRPGFTPRPNPYLAERIAAGETGHERLLGQSYAETLVANIEIVVRIIEVIADADGATLIHCTAGKDRTGMVIASILALLGADDSSIAVEYALTEAKLAGIKTRVEYLVQAIDPERHRDTPAGAALWNVLHSARPETMLAMLAILGRDHGGLATLLRSAGASPELERRLRDRAVDSAR